MKGKKEKGEFDRPVLLASESLSEIKLVSDKLEKKSIQMMVRGDQKEVQESLCFSFYNGSAYTLTHMECEIFNQTRGKRELFILHPVGGKWLNRNGFRKYYGDPKGIHWWTGNLWDNIDLKDRFEIRVVAAYGFKP